jgi:hypothetical protein
MLCSLIFLTPLSGSFLDLEYCINTNLECGNPLGGPHSTRLFLLLIEVPEATKTRHKRVAPLNRKSNRVGGLLFAFTKFLCYRGFKGRKEYYMHLSGLAFDCRRAIVAAPFYFGLSCCPEIGA